MYSKTFDEAPLVTLFLYLTLTKQTEVRSVFNLFLKKNMALKQQHYIYRLDIFKTDLDYISAMLFDLY